MTTSKPGFYLIIGFKNGLVPEVHEAIRQTINVHVSPFAIPALSD